MRTYLVCFRSQKLAQAHSCEPALGEMHPSMDNPAPGIGLHCRSMAHNGASTAALAVFQAVLQYPIDPLSVTRNMVQKSGLLSECTFIPGKSNIRCCFQFHILNSELISLLQILFQSKCEQYTADLELPDSEE